MDEETEDTIVQDQPGETLGSQPRILLVKQRSDESETGAYLC